MTPELSKALAEAITFIPSMLIVIAFYYFLFKD